MKTKQRRSMEAAKKARKSSSYRGARSFAAKRALRPGGKRKVLVADEKPEEVIIERDDEEEKPYTIMRYLGKPTDRLKARARELEVIDIAPAERITFGSAKALEAYRRDLYAVNGEKTSHFRSKRQGLTLTIWRDG